MANPFTGDPGYVAAFPVYMQDDEWLVVLDRQKIEPYSPEGARNRWLVKHSPGGQRKVYPTKEAAQREAHRQANSVHTFDHWWTPSDT